MNANLRAQTKRYPAPFHAGSRSSGRSTLPHIVREVLQSPGSGHSVYVPRTDTDPAMAMRDFLFELNNAIRAPKFAALTTEAVKGSRGTLSARNYAYKMAELEVEGMLRLGETWFKHKAAGGAHPEWNAYDEKFFLSEYEQVKAGRKTKDDVVRDVLSRVYETGTLRGKTVEQYYMDNYNRLSGGR